MSELAEPRPKYNAVNREVGSSPSVIARANDAISLVEEGNTLKEALVKCNLKRDLFASALAGQRELSVRYARAREISADFLVDEALEVVRNEPDVGRAREIANMHRWAASKFNSKRYGDRIDLNVTQSLDISGTLLEAKQRMLRPMRDQLDVIDAQPLANTSVARLGASDNQSNEPDIFAAPAPVEVAQAPADDVPDIFS